MDDRGDVLKVKTTYPTLEFMGSAGYNFTVVNLKCTEGKTIKGKVKVEKEILTTEFVTQPVAHSGCLKGRKRSEKKEIPKLVYEPLIDFPLSIQTSRKFESQKEDLEILIPSNATEKTYQNILEGFEKKYPSTVPGMDTKTLGMIGETLDREEAKMFGRNLGFPKSVIERFLNMSHPGVQIIMKYRGRLTHHIQRFVLITSLRAIGRHDLIQLLTSK